ncbi:LacI family DNA-binding transcriptional regulator [uncultured Cellulomonas sp.]|uniref:LacI family DNA-binding transcriptional regulator n=1 Tax=uncultured Cellulomonas sp. TaxID=189682 RepID=UPI0026215813|nr:LacI family DNA-binding transcriptional regulator [uncultured Cellulomonas sp.]
MIRPKTQQPIVRRPRISDIAREAGVSTAAVSYALNNRPGVSAQTRDRILEAAARLGWSPHDAARRLSSARSETIGMVIGRSAEVVATEPFFSSFTAGVSEVLSGEGHSLILQVVPDVDAEMSTLEKWWARRTVDGVLLLDPRVGDQRVRLVEELGVPAVVAGGPVESASVTSVWTDDEMGMREAVGHLVALGHRHFARISESPALLHSRIRTEAMVTALRDAGLPEPTVLELDDTPDSASTLTHRLLDQDVRPSILICDNDLVGISALTALRDRGLEVPQDISLMVWDDSLLCQRMTPTLSAMRRDVLGYGAQAARALLGAVQGAATSVQLHSVPVFIDRESTGPA